MYGKFYIALRGDPNYKYQLIKEIKYYSKRYNKYIIIPRGYKSDGATGAIDIQDSISWWVHDKLCDTGLFDDKTKCTNLQASIILSDILREEWGYIHPLRIIRSFLWLPATFLFGGGKARENGLFTLKDKANV